MYLLYISYYMADFYRSFIEMMTVWSANKMSSQLILKIYVKVIIYKNHFILAVI